MNVGQRISHPTYGEGTVIKVEGPTCPVEEPSNDWTRYKDSLNIAVRFDNGGPMGWAYNSTNDISELKEI